MATLSALPAYLGAFFNQRIATTSELVAATGAPVACFSANTTSARVQLGPSKHKIGGCEAEFGAILQKPDMICFGIPAGLFEAILNGCRTNGVTAGAFVNAGLKLRVCWHVAFLALEIPFPFTH
jgi:hypothetical protein